MEVPKPSFEIVPAAESLPEYASLWSEGFPGRTYRLHIVVPEAGSITSKLRIDDANQFRGMRVDLFRTKKGAPEGSGVVLLRILAHEASANGVTQISGYFNTPETLDAFGTVFGKDNLQFTPVGEEGLPSPTFDEAVMTPGLYTTTVALPPEGSEPQGS